MGEQRYTVVCGDYETTIMATSPQRAAELWGEDIGHESSYDGWEDIVHVIAPDDTCTEHLVCLEVEVVVSASAGTEVEDPRTEMLAERSRLAAMTEPPEDAWVTIGAHRWATDGHIAVREDGPRPSTMQGVTSVEPRRWVAPAPDIASIMPDASDRTGVDPAALVDPRMVPLLQAGRVVSRGGLPLSMIAVLDGSDEPIALVMPIRPGGPGVYVVEVTRG